MCVDSLLELIDNRVQKIIAKSSHINSEIGQIIAIDGALATVKLLTTNTTYTLPNNSGFEVRVGDIVYVYWKGSFLSPQSAYIGASARNGFATTYIYANPTIGALSSASAEILFESAVEDCTVNLVFNAVISASSAGNFTFTIYKDNMAETYIPTGTTISGGYVNCSFTLPLFISSIGNHRIEVQGSGSGEVIQMMSYIFGQAIKEGGTNG